VDGRLEIRRNRFPVSFRPFLYRVAIAPNGRLGGATAVPLTGDIVYGMGFNVNGIDATPNGRTLVIVQSNTGKLFKVNRDGVTDEIDLGGATVTAGDGILLDGKRLYVVRNTFNLIAVIRLRPNLSSGRIVREITHPQFDVPTTIDEFGPPSIRGQCTLHDAAGAGHGVLGDARSEVVR
jgi:hypothetical protein